MAKQNNAPEKRGGILGFFDSIKEFFQKLFEKISIALEFNKRVEAGNKYWDTSPEGEAQRAAQEKEQTFGFKTMEEHQHDQVEFPGLHEMKMQDSGLLRIPAKIDLLWKNDSPEAAAQRYIACIDTKFTNRPDPIQTHNGQAFAEIANDMRIALQRGDTSLHQFVLGNTHIVAQVQDGKVNLSMSDGTTTKMFIGKEPHDIADSLMSAYTDIIGKGATTFFMDQKNNTKTVCVPGEKGSEVFTAHAVKAWQGVDDNKSQYNVPNAFEISGSGRVDPRVVDAMIPQQPGKEVTESELRSIVTKAYKQVEATHTTSSAFVVGDKILWTSQSDGKTTFHLQPHHCQYQGVAPVTVPVTEKMFREEDNKLKVGALMKAVTKGIETVDRRVETAQKLDEQAKAAEEAARAAEAARHKEQQAKADPSKLSEFHRELVAFANTNKHPTMDDMPALAKQCQDMYGQAQINGRPADVIVCKTPEGPDSVTIVMTGYTRLNENGETVLDTQINLGGKCLYRAEGVQGEDGTITIQHKGEFDSPEKAFAHLAERTQGQVITRDRLELPVSALAQLPQNVREQLPQEYQDEITQFEADEAAKAENSGLDEEVLE